VPTTQASLQYVMMNQAVDGSLEMTAKMFGLPKETVVTIVQVGLPMIARMAETYPELRSRLHAMTLATLPEPMEDFYVHMTESRVLRQAIMDDYKATYGTMLDSVNRAAARQAGTTDGQARDVLAAVLPAVTLVLGQANTSGDAQSFAQRLKDLST
jgi:hypothetical protein